MANGRQHDEPMYAQIAESVRRDIDAGRFQARARLPGSRSMAVALGVSRTVVLMAYDQLESEGYLVSRSGSGCTMPSANPRGMIVALWIGSAVGSCAKTRAWPAS